MVNSASMFRAGVVLVNILGLFLTACETMSASALSNSDPCALTAPGFNVYRTDMNPQVRALYSQWIQNQFNSDPSIPQNIKNQAFTLLIDEVKRWTSSVDIPNGDIDVIRITLTFISPDLAQFILLNHQLYRNSLSEAEFEKMLITEMYEIGIREELIFLMTITYYSQFSNLAPAETNRVMVTIPTDRVMLTNSENTQVNAHSVDPHLRQEIVVSHGPSAGYVNFPMGVGTTENCLEVLDRDLNTEINVSTKGIRINGLDYEPQLTWFVKYHPLIEIDDSPILPVARYMAPQEIPINHRPPDPIQITSPNNEDAYWEQMALHVWGYVTDP